MNFSVLVAVYNVGPYLAKCLDSVLSQDFDDYEIIVVDDGSTDESKSICDDYRECFPERLKIIHKENQGLISARRAAIAEATGDYCVFVDADDYVSSDLLSSLASFIERNNVDVSMYSFTYFDNDGSQKSRKSFFEDGRIWTGEEKKELYELLATSSVIDSLVTKAVKTQILKDDKTDYESFYDKNMSEDTLQSIYPLTAARSVGYLDKSLYYYRYNPRSISRNFSVDTIKEKNSNHVYREILKYLPVWGLDTDEFKKKVDARWFNEAIYLFAKSYSSASHNERKAIFSFDWDSMIPSLDVFEYKEFVSDAYLQLYMWLKKNNYEAIKRYFFKARMYEKYKKIKRS